MKIPSRQTGSNFLCLYASSDFYCRRLAAFSRHPGLVAYAAGGRGQGLAQPLAPYDPVPRVRAAILDALSAGGEGPPSSSLPRGSGLSDSRCPALRGTSVRPASEVGAFFFLFFRAGRRLQPGIRAWSPTRRAAGGRGLRSPSPPTTPYPALGQPSLTRYPLAGRVPLPPLCRAAVGYRTPAVPLCAGRASVRRRSFRPSGAAISSAPCRAYISKACSSFFSINANHPLMQGRKNGFPPIDSVR